ncbi:MAG: hypothetical protein QG599_339 [Pseudomonadota bacterium]|nr:hypothetical protein [Pseudomonadota bacterium]
MGAIQLNPAFVDVLQPLGMNAGNFFLAASLYHAQKISFAAAAALANLEFEEFHYRLREHFGYGFRLEDDMVLEDITVVKQLAG